MPFLVLKSINQLINQSCNFSDKCVLNLFSGAGLATFIHKFYVFFHYEGYKLNTKEIRTWVFAFKSLRVFCCCCTRALRIFFRVSLGGNHAVSFAKIRVSHCHARAMYGGDRGRVGGGGGGHAKIIIMASHSRSNPKHHLCFQWQQQLDGVEIRLQDIRCWPNESSLVAQRGQQKTS